MDIKVYPAQLSGQVAAMPSKSVAHRALLVAALADKSTHLTLSRPGPLSQDILATISCIETLGGNVAVADDSLNVKPISESSTPVALDCGESGTTLRFILPLAAALGRNFTVCGQGRLPERPIGELCAALSEHGCRCSADHLPITVSGRLQAGKFVLPGNISSQYVSALLIAAPLLEATSKIILSSPLQSAGYVDLTCKVMQDFGNKVLADGQQFVLTEQGYSSPGEYAIEGDWSNAAFWLAAQQLGHSVEVIGIKENSLQPDHLFNDLSVSLGNDAKIDISSCPDLLPILAVLAACSSGTTHFVNAARLRLKESDRLAAVAAGLRALGIAVNEYHDELKVQGGQFSGGMVSGYNDHRMVMAWAIAALTAKSPVTIYGAEAVAKSYPDFWRDYQKLGGKIDVL